jgi:hypothetical protein
MERDFASILNDYLRGSKGSNDPPIFVADCLRLAERLNLKRTEAKSRWQAGL